MRMSSKMSSGWILAALLASGGSSLAMASEAEPETRKQAEIDYGNPPPPQRENAKVGDIGNRSSAATRSSSVASAHVLTPRSTGPIASRETVMAMAARMPSRRG